MRHARANAAVIACLAASAALPAIALAGAIEVEVLDRDGLPVPEVAVYAVATDESTVPSGARPSGARPPAEMSQSELAFQPHILVVETGTSVRFPNNDDVRHHVYSFSDAKTFDLTIDSGAATSVVFDKAGLVTLGCNIHDDMLAYVKVVDTPYFALTQGEGTVSMNELPPGRYEIHAWTPRLPEKALPAPITVELTRDGSQHVSFQFEKKLYPPHEHSETSLHWTHY
jgi:plastocyanin